MISSIALTTRADDRAHWLPAMGADQLWLIPAIGRGNLQLGDVTSGRGDPGVSQPSPAAVGAVVASLPGSLAAPLHTAQAATAQLLPGSKGLLGGGQPVRPPIDVTPQARLSQAEDPGVLAVGDASLLAVLGVDSARSDFDAGKVIGIGRGTTDHDHVALHLGEAGYGPNSGSAVDPSAVVVAATEIDSRPQFGVHYLISAQAAAARGFTTVPSGVLIKTSPSLSRPPN
jgi:hypothetical protein